ncbi:hypothetical protein CASFOL_006948 [Castilleja foliolosa]|uniref:J domain-containing protein n=1 Tax=Castilleja foliolosa TaxID=1961234 RepID=A0ABD3EBQ1_9LAMI
MECNKDEALRAKSIAESKLDQKDFAGSRKFALKAQNLYPGLEGISQMLTTLEVFISAEKRIGGQINWYSVLDVDPSADDDTIKKKYRKLALMLHPDKNNSVGAEGAFKLISGAWSLLSDKDKRVMYNQTMGFNFKGFQPKTPVNTTCPGPSMAHTPEPTGGPSPCTVPRPEPSTESSFSKSAKKKPPAPKVQKKSAKSSPAGPSKAGPAPPVQAVESFWTICGQCRIQYEYHKKYLNTTLLCPTCKTPFVAAEIPRPVTKPKSHKVKPSPPVVQPQQNPNPNPSRNPPAPAPSPANNGRGRNVVPEAQKPGAGQPGPDICMKSAHKRTPPPASSHKRAPPPASSGGVGHAAKSNPSPAAKVPKPQEKLKRAVTESKPSAGSDRHSKKKKLDDFKIPNGNLNFGNNFNIPNVGNTDSLYQEMSSVAMRKMMIKNGQKEVLNKLSESFPEVPADKPNGNKTPKQDNGQTQKSQKKSNSNSSEPDNVNDQTETMKMMNVPDPDFYDFDQDRTERSFADNDVWAAYDDDDGMPRFYALVHKVISKKPFRLKISWLNSKTTTEFGTGLDWVGLGFYKTCGEFRVGKHEVCKFVNAFSHRVKWSKGPRGAVLILPQKGDVWALYRNWSPDWDSDTPDDVIHKYDMVIVIDGYDEEKCYVSVAPLVKVVGYRTVFRPDMGDGAVVRIPKGEIFRFSHAVPHHELAGHEAKDLPRGCMELDPAATPLELLGTATGNGDVGPSGVNVETGPVKTETSQGRSNGRYRDQTGLIIDCR